MTTLPIHSVAAGLVLALVGGTPVPPDLCSLLSNEEAEAILGKQLEPFVRVYCPL